MFYHNQEGRLWRQRGWFGLGGPFPENPHTERVGRLERELIPCVPSCLDPKKGFGGPEC